MKKIILLIALVSLAVTGHVFAQTGIVRTVAGGGSYNGDGVAGNVAQLTNAYSVVTDAAENVYFPDKNGTRVRKVNAVTGIITTVAGTGIAGNTGNGGPATDAKIQQVQCIRIDGAGSLYLQDYWDGAIRKVDAATGIISHVAGNGMGAAAPDGTPATSASLSGHHTDFCVDDIGNIYVYDTTIRKVDVNTGLLNTIAGGGMSTADGIPSTAARIRNVKHMYFDPAGNLYFSSYVGGVVLIRKIDNGGIINTIAGGGTSTADGVPATSYSLGYNDDFAIEPSGNVLVTDSTNGIIRRINMATGIMNIIAGGGALEPDNVPAANANLSCFCNIHVSNAGNIFISRDANARVSKINDYPVLPPVVADSFTVGISKYCNGPQLYITTPVFIAGRSIKTYFGDGTTDSSTLLPGVSGAGYTSINHTYPTSGTYVVKHLLYNGSTLSDSAVYNYEYDFCRTLPYKLFYDLNANCNMDSSETYFHHASLIEVDSNGIAVDSVSAISGFSYNAYSVPGDIYKFRVINSPGGVSTICPASGYIADTVQSSVTQYPVQYFGLTCTSTSYFDLSTSLVITAARINNEMINIYVVNDGCSPTNATVTLHHSPLYRCLGIGTFLPNLISYTDTTISWDLTGLTSQDAPVHIYGAIFADTAAGHLTLGDTVSTWVEVTPMVGDAIPSNNIVYKKNAVSAAHDPNFIEVTPAGCINSGLLPTQLEYTIHFENMGTDTAYNIYVLDTLPAFVNASSLRMVMASAVMNIDIQQHDGYKVARFDFPNINLLDSSHHGECDGAFIYTINTNAGLIDGTDIMNRVGIYFDYNEVVMTNEVHNQIGGCWPTGVPEVKSIIAATLYPNPVTDILHIDAVAAVQYSITNIVGATLQHGVLKAGDNQLSVSSLSMGIYLITLTDKDGARSVHKVVKQ